MGSRKAMMGLCTIIAKQVICVTLSDIPGTFLTADMEGRVIILLEVENYTQAYIQNHLVQPEGKNVRSIIKENIIYCF